MTTAVQQQVRTSGEAGSRAALLDRLGTRAFTRAKSITVGRAAIAYMASITAFPPVPTPL